MLGVLPSFFIWLSIVLTIILFRRRERSVEDEVIDHSPGFDSKMGETLCPNCKTRLDEIISQMLESYTSPNLMTAKTKPIFTNTMTIQSAPSINTHTNISKTLD